jgi:membrane protease YdiL (CAAX protease family)
VHQQSVARRRAPLPLSRLEVALYAGAVVAVEITGAVAGPLAADIGYAVLLLVVVNHTALKLTRTNADPARRAASLAVVAIPLLLRLTSLTLERHSTVVVRHYAVIGGAATAALAYALIAFPELRPRFQPGFGGRGQLLIAAEGIPIGLFLAVLFSPSSISPQHGRWHNAAPLLALLVAAAVVEEVLFRGVLQTALRNLLGRTAPIAGTAALALVYLDVRPVGVVVAAVGLGLTSALVVERTRTIQGVLVGRILLLVGFVYAWPRLLHLH